MAVTTSIRIITWVAAAVLGTTAGLVSTRQPAAAVLAAAASGHSWTVQKSPDPDGNGGLNGIACPAGNRCVAVGSYYDITRKAQDPLAVAWYGTRWEAQPVPAPAGTSYSELHGVSCVKLAFCMAVGDDVLASHRWVTVAEIWKGTRWRLVKTPALALFTDNSLRAVSCTSETTCTAVGVVGQEALAERWNGNQWAMQRAARPAGSKYSWLTGVSCPTPRWCMAAGYSVSLTGATSALVETWTTKGWSISPLQPITRNQSALSRVACSSTTSCTAVGYGNTATAESPLSERWSGGHWTIQPVPYPKRQHYTQLLGVACPAAKACVAVGWYMTATGIGRTFSDTWNDHGWVLQATVNPSKYNNQLADVACSSAAACTAAGGYAGPGSVALTLIERYAAGTPTSALVLAAPARAVGPAQQPANGPLRNGNLVAVSCAGRRACEGVGSYFDSLGVSVGFAEGWRSTKPSLQSTPTPGGPGRQSQLQAVSCLSATTCQAVGSYQTPSGRQATLDEAWNGASWKVRATANPAGSRSADLSGLWCASANSCVAVGSYQTKGGNFLALAEGWNGSRWMLMRTPTPRGAVVGGFASLTAVRCTSATACVAVGSYLNSTERQVTLAESWDGTKWSLLPARNPAGASASMLFAISCTAHARCVAVGVYQARTGQYLALAEYWNGQAWSLRPTATSRGAVAVEFAGVACTGAKSCFAVGNVTKTETEVTLGEAWNGSRWAIRATPNAAGAISSALDAISCLSGHACTAVGFSVTRGGTGKNLAETWNGVRWLLLPVLDP